MLYLSIFSISSFKYSNPKLFVRLHYALLSTKIPDSISSTGYHISYNKFFIFKSPQPVPSSSNSAQDSRSLNFTSTLLISGYFDKRQVTAPETIGATIEILYTSIL